jgi:hypothetical protein
MRDAGQARPAPQVLQNANDPAARAQWEAGKAQYDAQYGARDAQAAASAPRWQGGAMPQPSMAGYQSAMQQQNGVPPALRQAIASNIANPSAYGAPEAQATFDRLNAALSEKFGLQRREVDNQMARRGLYDSTTAVGALGDVAIQQSRAQADLAGQIAEQQALQAQSDRQSANAQGIQLAGMDQNQGQFDVQQELARLLGVGGLNLQRDQLGQQDRQFGATQGLERDRLAQQDRQFGVDNQTQRDALLQQLAMFFGLPTGFGIDAVGTDATMETAPGATFTYGNATNYGGGYL